MPRTGMGSKRPMFRADGQPGQLPEQPPGQPNGRPLQADVPTRLPYGEGGALRRDIAQTPLPPGVSPEAEAARQHVASVRTGLTPLTAPTARPNESVLHGAPGGIGPVVPAAVPAGPQAVSSILGTMARAAYSPEIQALLARAQALGQ